MARALGDTSSITSSSVTERVRHRIMGKIAGRSMMGLGVFGLVAYAEFLQWLTNAVRRAAAKEMYLGTVITYASLYEFGLFGNVQSKEFPADKEPGRRVTGGSTRGYRHAPFFEPGVRQAIAKRSKGSSPISVPKGGRSGLYEGGKFVADLRSIVRGDITQRFARRAAGASSSRFFWGALANPDHNILEALAKQAKTEVRRKIKEQDLIDTRALLDSIQYGESIEEMKSLSRRRATMRLVQHGLDDQIQHKIADEVSSVGIVQ